MRNLRLGKTKLKSCLPFKNKIKPSRAASLGYLPLIFQMYLLDISEMTWLHYIDLFCMIKIFFISYLFKQGSNTVVSESKGSSHRNLVFYTGLFPFEFCSVLICNKLL